LIYDTKSSRIAATIRFAVTGENEKQWSSQRRNANGYPKGCDVRDFSLQMIDSLFRGIWRRFGKGKRCAREGLVIEIHEGGRIGNVKERSSGEGATPTTNGVGQSSRIMNSGLLDEEVDNGPFISTDLTIDII
jgi:hypothetical protein